MAKAKKAEKRSKRNVGDRLTARIPRAELDRWDALAKISLRDRTAEIRYRMADACDAAGIPIVKG